jgi:hypothetical protein
MSKVEHTADEILERIADEIIAYSDGSFRKAWSEEYDELTLEEQGKVEQIVFDNIANCDGCGWNFIIDALEQHSDGQCYCWQCYQDVVEEEDENND